MADSKISALTAVATPAGTDEFGVNQGGVSKKITLAQIHTNDVHAGYSEYDSIANPSIPAADKLRWYARNVSGRMFPKWMPPSGVDIIPQPALFGNRIIMFMPSTGTTGTGSGTSIGPAWTVWGGTVNHPTPSSASPAVSKQMKRTRYVNVATTTNQTLGIRMNSASEQQFWRGNAAELGGFFFQTRFIVELYPASTVRIWAGLVASSNSGPLGSDTISLQCCGLWHDTTDPSSGANSFNFVSRDGSTTSKQSIPLANAIAAGNSYDFYMFCKPNGSEIFWRLDDIVNDVTYEGSKTTNLPSTTSFMQANIGMSNGTENTTVSTVGIGIAGLYCESDR